MAYTATSAHGPSSERCRRARRERAMRDGSVRGSVISDSAGTRRPRDVRGGPAEAAIGCREASVVPGRAVRSPDSRAASTQRKLRREPGSSEVRVHVFVRVASVGQTHRALSPPKGRKASRRCKSTSQKEAHSLVGHGACAERWRTGARESDFPQRSSACTDEGASARSSPDTTEGVLGSHLEGPHRSRGNEVLRLAGQTSARFRSRRKPMTNGGRKRIGRQGGRFGRACERHGERQRSTRAR